ncbi:MAG: hypothetical protein U5L96_00750 [Owenweeksia sp.]|nr:hypothetical protein [Owenweeksia sp.]
MMGARAGPTFSGGLPNVPVNCVTIENNDVHSLYIGTDLGVFYRDSLQTEWVSFNANLPNVIVNELVIDYTNRKLRAATYGRGLWESPLFSDLVPPISKAQFPATVCVADTVSLTNISEYSPDENRWFIEPSTYSYVNGSQDSTESPRVILHQKGIYNISLVTENLIGKDSAFFVSAIAVGGKPLPYLSTIETVNDYREWTHASGPKGWQRKMNQSGYSFKANLYNDTSLGARYELISPAIDFSHHDSINLSFDYAYSGAPNNTSDSLHIYIAPSCDSNWTLVKSFGEGGSSNFITDTATANPFVPATGSWCGNNLASCPQY